MKIFLTGATGFIGSHIASASIERGHQLICLKRSSSSLERCKGFTREVVWLDSDSPHWVDKASALKPDAIVHAAWSGVTARERDDWKVQGTNVTSFVELLTLANSVGLKRFVALGSQAEYGTFCGRIAEDHLPQPNSAYAAAKLACLGFLQTFHRQTNLRYAWLRLFSVYGPGEGAQWLIPSLLRQFREGTAPQLTGCEQRYDYMHVYDLARGVLATVENAEASGVYHLTSNSSVPLRQIVEKVHFHSQSAVAPVFGALPYRPNQTMHMEGDSTRFYQTFAFAPRISLDEGLRQLVEQA